jgi:hypothetical protein
MNAIAWGYIAGGLLMIVAVAVPSRSSTITRAGGALFGVGAIVVGIARLQPHETPITYAGSIALVIGAVVYLIGTLRDRTQRR